MADYIIMDTTLTAIADSIRAKTGTTDKIYPADMATAISGITGGGGSAEGCVTVTFMNGAEVLFTRPVYIGDDCPDPVEQVRIDTPTKESTAQYTYTHNGWATADGGTADETALQNITEDKVLYAAYAAELVKYTVSFYDGDTLLATEQVAYGMSSSYTYTKDNFVFVGWTPKPTNVTGDMDCYGEWMESYTFADASWEYIASVADAGIASQAFAVGDTKTTTLTYADGTTESVTWEVVGFSGVDIEGTAVNNGGGGYSYTTVKAANLILTTKKTLSTLRRWHSSSGTASKNLYWAESELCSWMNTDFLSALPSDMQSVLQTQYIGITRYYDSALGDFVYTANHAKVSLPNKYNTFSLFGEGFGKLTALDSNSERKKYKNGTTKYTEWWLGGDTEDFTSSGYPSPKSVTTSGTENSSTNGATDTKGVVPMVVF